MPTPGKATSFTALGVDPSNLQWEVASGSSGGDGAVQVAILPDRRIVIRNSQEPDRAVVFTREEWKAFVAGARLGEFEVD